MFAQNIDALAELAESHLGDDALGVLMAQLLGSVVESAAFVDAVVHARELPDFDGAETINQLLAEPSARAQAAGLMRVDVSMADLILLVRMAYGAIVTQPDPDAARSAVVRAVESVDADPARAVALRWA